MEGRGEEFGDWYSVQDGLVGKESYPGLGKHGAFGRRSNCH